MTTRRKIRDAARVAVRAVERLCAPTRRSVFRTNVDVQMDFIEQHCNSGLDLMADAGTVAGALLLVRSLRGSWIDVERHGRVLAVEWSADVKAAVDAFERVVMRCEVARAVCADGDEPGEEPVQLAQPGWQAPRKVQGL